MASYEEDVEYAHKILRIRTAMIDGTLFKDHAFQCHDLGYGNYEVTFDHNGGIGVSIIGHLENRDNVHDESYAGYSRIVYTNGSNIFNMVGSEKEYHFLPTYPDEAWYFQASLVLNDEELRGSILIKTLAATPMPGFKQFIFMTHQLDHIIKRMDNNYDF